MQRVELLVVPLDRCAMDGIWFDHFELETALASALMPTESWFELFVERLRQMT